MQRAGFKTLLFRGLTRRCPICGGRKIFSGWYTIKDACPTCGYRFERESGYWVGAIIVNTAFTFALFALVFAVAIFATIPDVEWVPLLIVAATTNVVFPILFYPFSKTLWMALDIYFHPYRGDD